jgi:hypothetical protein
MSGILGFIVCMIVIGDRMLRLEYKSDEYPEAGRQQAPTMIPNHELKTWPSYFQAVWNGTKTFEVRKDDRGGFKAGQVIRLREWKPLEDTAWPGEGEYTGRWLDFEVGYIMKGETFHRDSELFGLKYGYCIMSIKRVIHCHAA